MWDRAGDWDMVAYAFLGLFIFVFLLYYTVSEFYDANVSFRCEVFPRKKSLESPVERRANVRRSLSVGGENNYYEYLKLFPKCRCRGIVGFRELEIDCWRCSKSVRCFSTLRSTCVNVEVQYANYIQHLREIHKLPECNVQMDECMHFSSAWKSSEINKRTSRIFPSAILNFDGQIFFFHERHGKEMLDCWISFFGKDEDAAKYYSEIETNNSLHKHVRDGRWILPIYSFRRFTTQILTADHLLGKASVAAIRCPTGSDFDYIGRLFVCIYKREQENI